MDVRTPLVAPDDLIACHLPSALLAAIPAEDRWWRGRATLVLWSIGNPLRMAWALASDPDPAQVEVYRYAMSQLADDQLETLLAESVEHRRATAAWP